MSLLKHQPAPSEVLQQPLIWIEDKELKSVQKLKYGFGMIRKSKRILNKNSVKQTVLLAGFKKISPKKISSEIRV